MTQNQPDPSGAFALQTTKPQGAIAEYIPFGGTEKIKLTCKIIQDLIAVPTRSGKTCSERDAMKFMMLCRSRALNPWEGDCFMLGYDGNDGPTFSLITAHQAFLKRAEPHPEFDGMESGVIVSPALACPMCSSQGGREVNGNWVICSACKGIGQTDEVEGDMVPQGHELMGGWAKVHFKNRKVPMKKRIALKTFNSGYSRWKVDAAGMICKCAEADALRSSFPTKLGGLYMQEEQQEPKMARVEIPTDLERPAIPQVTNGNTAEAVPEAVVEKQATVKPEPKRESKAKTGTPLSALEARMTLEGIAVDEVIEYLVRKRDVTPSKHLKDIGMSDIEYALSNAEAMFTQIRFDRSGHQQPN